MRIALTVAVALCLTVLGCGDSDGSPAPGGPGAPGGTTPGTTPGTPSADPDPDSFGNGTIFATFDGVAFDFQQNSQADVSRDRISLDAFNSAKIALFLIGVDGNRVGTFDCASREAGTTMGGQINRATWIAGREQEGSGCSLTFTEVATVVGQHWRGTFSGSLVNTAGGPKMQVTNGTFDFVRTR